MAPWILIAVAVLGAGCEQLRSPQRITELDDRINKLTAEVVALKAKAPAPRPDEPPGSGSAGAALPAAAGSGSDVGSTGEHDAPGAHDGSDRAATVEPAVTDAGATDAAKPDDAKRDDAEPAKPDAARPDDVAKDDPRRADPRHDAAMDHLMDIVAKNTTKPTHGEPAGEPDAPHWGYDGKAGPPTWGTLDPAWHTCLTGKAQSPIDIEPRAGTATPIGFHYKPTAATIIDNGHTLQVNVAPGSSIEIDGVAYDLVQFHFHTPSEHTIAGEHYPLEVHLVHKDGAGKLAVIGVLYDIGAESKVLAGLWSAWPRTVGVEDRLKKPFDPSALLPETRSVFRYTGSLTTPPCTEGVVWNVMRRTPSDARAHLEAFGLHYKLNARTVQPLGDRKIE